MIAFVRSVIRLDVGRVEVERVGSISAKTGSAPTRDRLGGGVEGERGADHLVAGPIPSASRTITSASVPFATLTPSCTPRYSAASRSKASTSGPKMNRAVSRVLANASWTPGSAARTAP